MPGDRNLAIDLWTRDGLVACRYETRLLFVAMQNFADDHGVQPLRPGAIRRQIFPADTDMDDARVRSMIEELAANKLVRIYEVDGQEYVALVDWTNLQHTTKRTRRKYPAEPSMPQATAQPSRVKTAGPAPTAGESQHWRTAVEARMRARCPDSAPIEAGELERAAARWIAEGCDLEHDVLAAVDEVCATQPDRKPFQMSDLAATVEANRVSRLAPPRMAA
jgi:hypothetical protein